MTESRETLRILLLADSHLGFDLPLKPRVSRRRRGLDFLQNHEMAISAALSQQVDLVVHGGDVFHRSQAPPSLVFQAFRPLLAVADKGIPVVVVPGNHERSRIPHDHLARHPNLHLFRSPSTFTLETRMGRVAISGFPYHRRRIRECFRQVLGETGWNGGPADIRLLCMHHCVEGATVGPGNFTFRGARDVIRCSQLPPGFAAVLSGHIHRHQILRTDLHGHSLPTPVFYPGSVERTAFAETGEDKGYLLLEVRPNRSGGEVVEHTFIHLPARPMLAKDLRPGPGAQGSWDPAALRADLVSSLASSPRDAVLRLRVSGRVPAEARAVVSAAGLRKVSPPEMNVDVVLVDEREPREGRGRRMPPPRPGPNFRKTGS